jgi:ABC-2 type transport system permease protein
MLRASLLPSARSAQAVGLLMCFPSFLRGGGGLPPRVTGLVLRHAAGPLPLRLLTSAVRGPWLGLGLATGRSWAMAMLAAAVTIVAVRRTAL